MFPPKTIILKEGKNRYQWLSRRLYHSKVINLVRSEIPRVFGSCSWYPGKCDAVPCLASHTLVSNTNVNLALLKKKMMDTKLAGFLCRSKTPCIVSIQHSIKEQRSQVLCVGKCVFVCVDPVVVTTAPPFGNNLTPTCILRKVKRERQE